MAGCVKVTVKARVPANARLEELPLVVVEASGYGAPRTVCPAIYHPMTRCTSPHAQLSIAPCPAIDHARHLSRHAPLSIIPADVTRTVAMADLRPRSSS